MKYIIVLTLISQLLSCAGITANYHRKLTLEEDCQKRCTNEKCMQSCSDWAWHQ